MAREDKRWFFYQSGDPIAEEDVAAYDAKRKRDRLNEHQVALLLARLGAKPWSEEFYALPEQPCFVLRRAQVPAAVITRPRAAVLRAG